MLDFFSRLEVMNSAIMRIITELEKSCKEHFLESDSVFKRFESMENYAELIQSIREKVYLFDYFTDQSLSFHIFLFYLKKFIFSSSGFLLNISLIQWICLFCKNFNFLSKEYQTLLEFQSCWAISILHFINVLGFIFLLASSSETYKN